MNLTTEQKKHITDTLSAAMNGESVQWWDDLKWIEDNPFRPATGDWIQVSPDRWRIAPKKVVRDWNCVEDVPLDCWFKNGEGGPLMRLVCVFHHGVAFCDSGIIIRKSWRELKPYKYTNDGVTYKPCTVEEQQ